MRVLPKKEKIDRAEAREPTWESAIGATAKIHHVCSEWARMFVVVSKRQEKDCSRNRRGSRQRQLLTC